MWSTIVVLDAVTAVAFAARATGLLFFQSGDLDSIDLLQGGSLIVAAAILVFLAVLSFVRC